MYNQCVIRGVKPIEFLGSSLADLAEFPAFARREAGFQLFQVQNGIEPDSWKSMSGIGAGVKEIRLRNRSGAFRVIYIASLGDAVYVLHCFQKKTQATRSHDIELAKKRYRGLMKEKGL